MNFKKKKFFFEINLVLFYNIEFLSFYFLYFTRLPNLWKISIKILTTLWRLKLKKSTHLEKNKLNEKN